MNLDPFSAISRVLLAALALTFCPAQAEDNAPRQYTFAWQFLPQDSMAPRGGTTRGAAVDLVQAPGPAWLSLREPGLDKQERDRRAILAMAGPYRASFDFIETMGFVPDYTPPAPYQSWGTEYVYVVADEPDFVSLQHILVMLMVDENGNPAPPVVVKHWRQDWRYEDRDLYVYKGHNRWSHQRLSRRQAQGAWTQAVYQVDDSPRYESFGRWIHSDNYSSWRSAETWRPLPRREFSVRSDYHALVGYNRHTITPTGWVHNEANRKTVLSGSGEPAAPYAVLAEEAGLNRYERINKHDWFAGDKYWADTGRFWAAVRTAWADLLARQGGVQITSGSGGPVLFAEMFQLAENYAGDSFDPDAAARDIDKTLAAHTTR